MEQRQNTNQIKSSPYKIRWGVIIASLFIGLIVLGIILYAIIISNLDNTSNVWFS